MQKNDPQTPSYTQHYQQLKLSDRDDWETARIQYRRLVNLWHPDRFAQRPRERAHAQQQFIDLTKSYNALRSFYRQNSRLPFQSAYTAGKNVNSETPESEARQTDPADATLDINLLGREARQRSSSAKNPKHWRNIAWLAGGGTIVLGTIMFFLILDRSTNRAIAEKGREIVKDAPQSEFLPSASEIRRSQTRGAFVKPTQ